MVHIGPRNPSAVKNMMSLHVVGMMLYCRKVTGEDLSRYLNKLESLSLRKAYC